MTLHHFQREIINFRFHFGPNLADFGAYCGLNLGRILTRRIESVLIKEDGDGKNVDPEVEAELKRRMRAKGEL